MWYLALYRKSLPTPVLEILTSHSYHSAASKFEDTMTNYTENLLNLSL